MLDGDLGDLLVLLLPVQVDQILRHVARGASHASTPSAPHVSHRLRAKHPAASSSSSVSVIPGSGSSTGSCARRHAGEQRPDL